MTVAGQAQVEDVRAMVELAARYEELALRHFTLGVMATSLPLDLLVKWAVIVRLFGRCWKRGDS